MHWRRSLGLAMISFGLLLVFVTIRHLVREETLLLIQPVLGTVLIVKGWDFLGFESGAFARRWSGAVTAAGDRRRDLILAGAAGVLAVLVAVVALSRSDDYPEGERDAYVAGCTQGDVDMKPLCTCTLEHLESTVDYEQYLRLDATGRGFEDQPPELQDAIATCVSDEDITVPDRLRRELD